MSYSIREPPRPNDFENKHIIERRGVPTCAHGNIYLFASREGLSQKVESHKSIKFNSAENLVGLIWNGSDTIKIITNGIYKIQFEANYKINGNPVQIGVLVNERVADGYHGQFLPSRMRDSGVAQISGEYLLSLKKDDKIRLINSSKGSTIKIKNAGPRDERIANLSVIKIN